MIAWKTATRLAALTALALLLAACTTGKIPVAADPASSALAISVDATSHSSLLVVESIKYQTIFFVKLADEKDELTKRTAFRTNFRYEPWLSGFQFGSLDYFLLGVEPGIYAAVGGMGVGTNTGARIYTYFPEDMIRDSIVEVAPGEMAYMGKYVLTTARNDQADPTQIFYYDTGVLAHESRYHGKTIISPVWSPQFQAPKLESFENSRQTELDFLKARQGTFDGTDWAARVAKRLQDLL